MKSKSIFLFFLIISILAYKENMSTKLPLQVNDPALHKIISPDAVIDTFAEGFTWSEDPVWI